MENSFMTWRVSAVLRVIEDGLGRELLLWRSSTPAELRSKKRCSAAASTMDKQRDRVYYSRLGGLKILTQQFKHNNEIGWE